MAKQPKQTCPYGCPLCALYEAQQAFQEGIRECVPPEVGSHVNRAGRELLLAVRALLDRGLEALVEEPKPGSRRKAQRVKVE
jgi:hypothetical protein